MRVRFDEPWHQRGARQIDCLRAGRRDDARGWAGGFDALAAHEHRPALLQGLAIEDARGTKQDRGRSGRAAATLTRTQRHRRADYGEATHHQQHALHMSLNRRDMTQDTFSGASPAALSFRFSAGRSTVLMVVHCHIAVLVVRVAAAIAAN